MPDAHWGYGFPIGGVAAFDADAGGVVSAGGVGFDISCGVRTLLTRLDARDIAAAASSALADALCSRTSRPAWAGRAHRARRSASMDAMLRGGARWAVEQGYGSAADLERIEEHGCMAGAEPDRVSEQAKKRQRGEMGTLGLGQPLSRSAGSRRDLSMQTVARRFGLRQGEVRRHASTAARAGWATRSAPNSCARWRIAAPSYGIELPDRELACAPINSRARPALSRRHARGDQLRAGQPPDHHPPDARGLRRLRAAQRISTLLFDVSHNTCKAEWHAVDGETARSYVHRKGATRAFGPGHPTCPRRCAPSASRC